MRCFSSPGCLLTPYCASPKGWFVCGYPPMTADGSPHSEIPGSKPADGSPRLNAANHVLLRLVAPRHPPCALNSSAPRDAPCRANRHLSYVDDLPCIYALVKVHGVEPGYWTRPRTKQATKKPTYSVGHNAWGQT